MHVVYRMSAVQYLPIVLETSLIGSEVGSGIHEHA